MTTGMYMEEGLSAEVQIHAGWLQRQTNFNEKSQPVVMEGFNIVNLRHARLTSIIR